MENRKFVKFIIPVFILGFFAFNTNPVFAYWIDTHALLTKDAVEFYSEKVGTTTINNFIDYLVDGARKEDDVPRWMNHFYDPVYDRGLTMDSKIDPFYVLGNWNKSKDWVANSDLQNEMKYKVPTTVASILTAVQQGRVSNLTTKTDFTWNEALYFWINGEKEKAMFALGHILHLIQDVSVPDHTRNDPHPEGSIYEKWTSQFSLNNPDNKLLPKLATKNLIGFDNLGSYFDELAKYSNNNFYSKDTIGIQSGYDLPEPDFTSKEGDYFYGFKSDREGNNYKLFVKERQGLFGTVVAIKGSISLLLNKKGGDKVVSDYWSLLSSKAVQYSASVIDLFFKEAERLKDDPQFVKKESFFAQVVDVAKGIVSAITDTVKDIVSIVKDNAQIQDQNLLTSVSLDENNSEVQLGEQKIIGPSLAVPSVQNELALSLPKELVPTPQRGAKEVKPIVEEPRVVLKQYVAPEMKQPALNSPKKNIASSTQNELLENIQICSFQTTKVPTYQKLLINEVAWMGSVKNSSDEWIELKNISNSELDVSNWQILDKEEQIKITFPENIKISVGGFLLLERTDDNSVPNVKADIIYTGAISNSNEALRLFDDKCNLIDEVFANSEWPAGDSPTKRTMERQADLTWWTYNGAGEGSGDALILGTPKKENMVKVISYGGGGGGGGGGGAATAVVVVETNNNSNIQPSKILISEIQITGGAGKTDNDFIELYNPNDASVNLKGYRLVKRTKTGTTDTSIKSWTDDAYIESKSYYLWANSDYKDIFTLPNATTSASLANDNGVALRFGAEDTGTIIDSVAWGAAENAFIGAGVFSQNPGASQSIQRKFQDNTFIDTDNNAADFEIQNCSSPKAQSASCQSAAADTNQAPGAFFVFSTTTPKTGEEIIFNATSSTDADGNIALYDWNYGDGSLATSTQATTTHSYLLVGDYNVSLTVFDNLNATSTISKTITVSANVVSNQAPMAVFNFLPVEPKINEAIIFNAASSTDLDGNIVLYDWNFGDPSASSGQATSTTFTATTTHSYLLAGNYKTGLTVWDNQGATSTAEINFIVASSTADSDNSSGHILISEIMPGMGTGKSDEEFVELYNPNNIAIDLTGYSLRKKTSAVATSSTPLVSMANFSNKIIPAKGFLLITSPNYSASSTADVIYSSASYGLANDNDQAVLLRNSVGETADEVYYVSIPDGKSLERKALSSGICVSAQGDGTSTSSVQAEFLGNGCDINNDESDFDIRNIPAPQNSQNFPEPRNKPIVAANFIGEYNKANKKINLSWNESHDYSGATSTLSYLISDISANPVLGSITTSSTTAEFNITEIGRDYVFEIKVTDREGLSSDISTATVSVPSTSIEDVNYLLVNQTNCNESSGGDVGQIFRPTATGVLSSITMKMYASNWGHSDARLYIYEWNGNASSTLETSKGNILVESIITDITPNVLGYTPEQTWNFSGANNIVLEKEKYYYLEAKNGPSSATPGYQTTDIRYCIGNSNSLIDGDGWSGPGKNDLYLIINAVKNGSVSLQEPIDNQVYYDSNLNYKIKYLEPADKKYSSITMETTDFFTGATVDSQTISLSDSEQTIGWHEISRNLNMNRAGYFKTKISLSDSIKSEINFSVFGAEPPAGKLLNQNSYSTNIGESQFSGQIFRPAVSGWADSLSIIAIANGSNVYHGYNYWSVYEWNGNGNSLTGSQGNLLATTSPLYLTSNDFTQMSWGFTGDGLYLDSTKYYLLTLNKVTNGGQVPHLSMKISSNGSLIDGRLIAQYINQGDLYLILNKKPD